MHHSSINALGTYLRWMTCNKTSPTHPSPKQYDLQWISLPAKVHLIPTSSGRPKKVTSVPKNKQSGTSRSSNPHPKKPKRPLLQHPQLCFKFGSDSFPKTAQLRALDGHFQICFCKNPRKDGSIHRRATVPFGSRKYHVWDKIEVCHWLNFLENRFIWELGMVQRWAIDKNWGTSWGGFLESYGKV